MRDGGGCQRGGAGAPQEHRSDSLSAAYRNLSGDQHEDAEEREILKISRGLVCSGDRHGVRVVFELVRANQAMHGVSRMCRVLGVSLSRFYA